MRDWDSLQVPALAYDSLVWMKPEQSCHMNWTLNLLVGIMKKKLLFLYRIYAYILLIGNVTYITLQTSAVCAIWLVVTYLDKIKFTTISLSYFIGKTMNNTF